MTDGAAFAVCLPADTVTRLLRCHAREPGVFAPTPPKIAASVKLAVSGFARLSCMRVETRQHYERLVLRAVDQLRASLDCGFDIAALGRAAFLSPLHFHRIFRGLIGETPGELHRRLRLERAACTLAATDHAVTRIALEAGYDAHESFTRAFAAAFGLSPSEFRARAHESPTSWGASSASTLASPCSIHFNADNAAAIRFSQEQAKMNVTVETMPAKRVLAAEHRGPYNMISAAFARLDDALTAAKLDLGALECVEMVALYHDDAETVPAAELRADAGIVVPAHVATPPGLHEVNIPAGRYARTLHQGPYEQLGDAWARFMGGWLVQSGHRIGAGSMYERYLNTPMNAAPHELLTELFLGLADDDVEQRANV